MTLRDSIKGLAGILLAGALTFTSDVNAGQTNQYKIEQGDTYYKISRKTGIPAKLLYENNPGIDPLKLQIGQMIYLSDGKINPVVEKDSSTPKQLSIDMSDLSKDEVFINQLKRHEGYRLTTYLDSKGIPTIGIGFNLQKAGARKRINAFGLNYEEVLSKKQSLTKEQAMQLFDEDVREAISDARSVITNYDSHPIGIKRVLADLSFNMGKNRFSGFKKAIDGFHRFDYQTAAKEMKDSLWYNQTGDRSEYLVEIVRNTK